MPLPPLRLDSSRTTIEIRTFVEGALARVAHSLCLGATRVEGTATPGDIVSADVRIPIDGMVVRGVLRGESVDSGVLSDSDRREIERRIREDVFKRAAMIDVHADSRSVRARWNGGESSATVSPKIEQLADQSWRSTGRARLSLSALGIKPVYGPLRAFRVSDEVEIRWDAVFATRTP